MWKEAGVKVIPVVASVALAKRMERCGADALVAEGTEAGGHIGENTTMVLVPQVADAVSIPVIAAGGIADLIAKSGKYKSWKKTVISCGVFNLWVSASYLPLILTADSYKQSLIESGFDASFADTLFTLVTPATYPVIILLCFVC